MCGLSSTAVVVKLLYDKGELDTLPGRMTLGMLVIQDIYAIFVLAFQPNFANPSFGPVAKALRLDGRAAGRGVRVQQVRPAVGVRVDRQGAGDGRRRLDRLVRRRRRRRPRRWG